MFSWLFVWICCFRWLLVGSIICCFVWVLVFWVVIGVRVVFVSWLTVVFVCGCMLLGLILPVCWLLICDDLIFIGAVLAVVCCSVWRLGNVVCYIVDDLWLFSMGLLLLDYWYWCCLVWILIGALLLVCLWFLLCLGFGFWLLVLLVVVTIKVCSVMVDLWLGFTVVFAIIIIVLIVFCCLLEFACWCFFNCFTRLFYIDYGYCVWFGLLVLGWMFVYAFDGWFWVVSVLFGSLLLGMSDYCCLLILL